MRRQMWACRASAQKVQSSLDVGGPNIGWVSLAEGLGVPASPVETTDEFARDFDVAIAEPGPRLNEVLI